MILIPETRFCLQGKRPPAENLILPVSKSVAVKFYRAIKKVPPLEKSRHPLETSLLYSKQKDCNARNKILSTGKKISSRKPNRTCIEERRREILESYKKSATTGKKPSPIGNFFTIL